MDTQIWHSDAGKVADSGQSRSEIESAQSLHKLLLESQGPFLPEAKSSISNVPGLESLNKSDSDHVDVGLPLSWSYQTRRLARPQPGQGYYDVMNRVGANLLGRNLLTDEIKLLDRAASALQEMRGKNPQRLTTFDELLPKNQEELSVFMNNLKPAYQTVLSDRQVHQLSSSLQEVFERHVGTPVSDQVVMDLRPVTDQSEVTKVVPDAVYIDSSNIEGAQGYRRKPDCQKETQEYWLSKPTAEAFMQAQTLLINGGHDPIVINNMNGAGRRAIDRELISKCAPDQPHAKKHSTHEDGISVDVNNYADENVRKALTQVGFVHNVDGDRPHFTWFEPEKKQ